MLSMLFPKQTKISEMVIVAVRSYDFSHDAKIRNQRYFGGEMSQRRGPVPFVSRWSLMREGKHGHNRD